MKQVVILERSKIVGRRIARHFAAVGAAPVVLQDTSGLDAAMTTAAVLCADTFDGDAVVEQLRNHPAVDGVLWTAEPLKKSLRYMEQSAAIQHVLARKDFDSAPRDWELAMVAHRVTHRTRFPTLDRYLDWGAKLIAIDVKGSSDRDLAVSQIQSYVGQLQVPSRVVDMFGELSHELIMNAIYDAPIDDHGLPLFAADRKADVALSPRQRPQVIVGSDGTKLGLQVRDPFGCLQRQHVIGGMLRGLCGGVIDRQGGGAGLGMMVCHHSSSAMFFDVVHHPENHEYETCVTAIFELDVNLREFRMAAKSLHVVHHRTR